MNEGVESSRNITIDLVIPPFNPNQVNSSPLPIQSTSTRRPSTTRRVTSIDTSRTTKTTNELNLSNDFLLSTTSYNPSPINSTFPFPSDDELTINNTLDIVEWTKKVELETVINTPDDLESNLFLLRVNEELSDGLELNHSSPTWLMEIPLFVAKREEMETSEIEIVDSTTSTISSTIKLDSKLPSDPSPSISSSASLQSIQIQIQPLPSSAPELDCALIFSPDTSSTNLQVETSLLPAFTEFIHESFNLDELNRNSLELNSSLSVLKPVVTNELNHTQSSANASTFDSFSEVHAFNTPRSSIDFKQTSSPVFKRLSKIQNHSLKLERGVNVEDLDSEVDQESQLDFESSGGLEENVMGSAEEDEEEVVDEEEEEEEDPDSNPLYLLLSTSTIPSIKQAWNSSSLILLPPRKTLPSLSSLVPLLECLTPRNPSSSAYSSSSPNTSFQVVRGAKGILGEQMGRDRQKERADAEKLEIFIRSHAFKKEEETGANGNEVWRSVGGDSLQVRLELSRGLVHVESVDEASSSSPLTRSLQIVSETSIYRRPFKPLSSITSPSPTTSPSPLKSLKPAFRAPKWLRRGGSSANLPVLKVDTSLSNNISSRSKAPILERVRVIALDSPIVFNETEMSKLKESNSNLNQSTSSTSTSNSNLNSSRFNRVTSSSSLLNLGNESKLRRVGSMASTRSTKSTGNWNTAGLNGNSSVGDSRDFVEDLVFLATPPSAFQTLQPIFLSTLILIRSLVKDFEANFVYIKGFDSYIVHRIRTGIWETTWSQLKERLDCLPPEYAQISIEERSRLCQLLENVIIGLLYNKIYRCAIFPLFISENAAINHILSLYRAGATTPADLGVDICDFGRGDLLRNAVNAMTKLGNFGVTIGSISPELINVLSSNGDDDVLSMLVKSRTPLGCISVMRLAIEEIVAAVEFVKPGARVAPDDLIPLLAWVIIQSGLTDLESLLYFVKAFRLGESLAPELDWSFVTFQAASTFLLSDPLNCLSTSPLLYPIIPPSNPVRPPTASELPSFRSRRSSLQNPSTNSYSDRPRSPTNTSPRSLRTLRPLIKPRITATSRALGLAISTVAVSPVRERMASSSSRFKKESIVDVGEIDFEKEGSSYSHSSNNNKRRQSLGSLPDSRIISDSILESPISTTFETNRRPLSIASSSSASELHIRPRIIIPYRANSNRSTHYSNSTSSFSRTSSIDRQIGPISPDMNRSGSEGSSRPVNLRGQSEPWSFKDQNRSLSPSLSTTSTSNSGHRLSDWWSRSDHSHETSASNTSASACKEVEEALLRSRTRRNSTGDDAFCRTFSLPEPSTSMLSSSTTTPLPIISTSRRITRPRPTSFMSFDTSSSNSTNSSPTIPFQRNNKGNGHSSIRRELFPTSDTLPLEPKLDASTVIFIPSESNPLSFNRTNSISSLSKFSN